MHMGLADRAPMPPSVVLCVRLRSGGKIRSVRHTNISVIQTGIFGRMERALGKRSRKIRRKTTMGRVFETTLPETIFLDMFKTTFLVIFPSVT